MSIFCRCWRKVPPPKASCRLQEVVWYMTLDKSFCSYDDCRIVITGQYSSDLDMLDSLLVDLNIYFPRTFFACVIETQTGNGVGSAATSTVDAPITLSLEEVGTAVSGLKHAATQFSHVFQQGVCRVVHIHGEEVFFSCFDLGNEHVLAFYSEKPTQSLLDIEEADRGVEKATAELRTILSPSNGGIR